MCDIKFISNINKEGKNKSEQNWWGSSHSNDFVFVPFFSGQEKKQSLKHFSDRVTKKEDLAKTLVSKPYG